MNNLVSCTWLLSGALGDYDYNTINVNITCKALELKPEEQMGSGKHHQVVTFKKRTTTTGKGHIQERNVGRFNYRDGVILIEFGRINLYF